MKVSPIVHRLNAGELSPLMAGRSDLTQYAGSCRLLQNFIALVQGPATRRGGTQYTATKKTPTARGWLLRFEFSATQAWILEFGDLYVRFYTNHGQVVVSGVVAWNNATPYVVGDLVVQGGINYYCILAHTNQVPPNATYWYPLTGNIYEIPSPYALADLTNDDGTCALKSVQSGDVVYIANQKRTYEARKLTRFGNTNWQFSLYRPNQGPFLEQNIGSNTIQANAATGSVTLTAGSALFASTDVGRLIRLESQDLSVQPWETAKAYALNDLVRNDGKTYKCTDAGTSGTSPPIHERGTAYDGTTTATACRWEYQNAGYGIARITAFSTATSVTASVIVDEPNGLKLLPADVVSATTTRWSLGAWAETTEFPATVTFYRARLWWGGRTRYWGSVPNDFENLAGDFFGEIRVDNAIWRQLAFEDVNEIVFMLGASKLVIGTPGGEFVVGEITTTQPLGPANIKEERHSKYRSRAVQPLAIGSKVIYVQRAGRKLLSLGYDFNSDVFESNDLAVLADRMSRAGIVDMAYQAEPYSIIWCVLKSGGLVALTYNEQQQVTGWHRHLIGGLNAAVESVGVIPSPDGLGDELWLLVARSVGGATTRHIEFMRRPWEGRDNDGSAGDDPHNAFYVDTGLSYSGIGAIASIQNIAITEHRSPGTPHVKVLVTTASDHNLLVGQQITISGVIGTGTYTQMNAANWVVQSVLDSKNFRLINKFVYGTVTGAYTSGGQFQTQDVLATTITGLEHLNGEVVQILADAAVHPNRTVSGGQIVLDHAATVVHVGLPCPARIVTSDLEAGGPAGTSAGKAARIYRLGVRFIDTLGGKIGKPEEDLTQPSTLDEIDWRVPDDQMDSAPPFRSTVVDVTFPGEWEREKSIDIVQEQPLPMTVANLMPRLHVNDR